MSAKSETGDRAVGGVRGQIALLFTTGTVVALAWVFAILPRLSSVDQVFDIISLGRIGEGIYRSEGFNYDGSPTVRRAPLYPTLIAGVLRLFGYDETHRYASYVPLFVLQCLFAGLTCVLVYLTTRKLFGVRSALIAGALCAVWPQCYRYAGSIDVEATMTLLITLMTYAAVCFYQQPTVRNGLFLGLAVSLAALTKPLPMLFPLAMLALFFLRSGRARLPVPWKPLAACAGTFLVLCLPWVVRNYVVTGGRFVGISCNASGEFIRGYVVAQPRFAFLKTQFQGTWDWEANLYEDAILRKNGFYLLPEVGGEKVKPTHSIEFDLTKEKIENRVAKEMVLGDPVGFLRKVLIQLFTFWYLVETRSKSLIVGGLAALALALAFIGWRAARREGIDVSPVIAVVVYFNVLYAVMLSFARYSMPVFPSLLILSGHGLAVLPGGRRREATRADKPVRNEEVVPA
jgi:4-amino-4-deoxy-L-arabinose transferase-like glycosyltransferase